MVIFTIGYILRLHYISIKSNNLTRIISYKQKVFHKKDTYKKILHLPDLFITLKHAESVIK